VGQCGKNFNDDYAVDDDNDDDDDDDAVLTRHIV